MIFLFIAGRCSTVLTCVRTTFIANYKVQSTCRMFYHMENILLQHPPFIYYKRPSIATSQTEIYIYGCNCKYSQSAQITQNISRFQIEEERQTEVMSSSSGLVDWRGRPVDTRKHGGVRASIFIHGELSMIMYYCFFSTMSLLCSFARH